MRARIYVCLAACLFGGTHVSGQISSNNNASEFRGRLVEGGSESYQGLVVELTNLKDRTIRERVDVTADGSFGFRTIPDGDYQVRVLTLYGDELVSTVASIGPFNMALEIRLPRARLSKPISGTISVQQLSHPPSRQVRKLLESGHRLIQDQHFDDAAARFREAAKDDPDCVQAHADLGLALSRMAAWQPAAEEYRTAVALEPGNSVLHSNLGAALAVLNRFDEAETEATTALRLDPRNARAHFVMAGVLSRKRAPPQEVVSHLLAAQDAVPSAKASVERICASHRVPGCP